MELTPAGCLVVKWKGSTKRKGSRRLLFFSRVAAERPWRRGGGGGRCSSETTALSRRVGPGRAGLSCLMSGVAHFQAKPGLGWVFEAFRFNLGVQPGPARPRAQLTRRDQPSKTEPARVAPLLSLASHAGSQPLAPATRHRRRPTPLPPPRPTVSAADAHRLRRLPSGKAYPGSFALP